MKLKFIILLSILSLNNVYAKDDIVGVWASPNSQSPKILWYLYKDGKVKVSTNASYNQHKLIWMKVDEEIIIQDKSLRLIHAWEGRFSKTNILGKHFYRGRKGKKIDVWQAEKYSNNPNKKIEFYALCSNKENVWQIVNVGSFDKCGSITKVNGATSFQKAEVLTACKSLVKRINTKSQNLNRCNSDRSTQWALMN